MNAFYEHHQDSIRFGYRCFDRILLNGLIQPFQQPERVIGFFNTYRDQYPVSRKVLRDIADQFQGWVKNRSQKWDVPILDAPPGRRDEFVEPYFRRAKPDEVVVILKAREPARIMIAIGNPKDDRWHLQFAQRWIIQYNFYVNDRHWGRMFVRVCPYFPFSARVCLNQHHWLANRMRAEGISFQQCTNAFLKCGNPETAPRAGRLPDGPRPVELRGEVAHADSPRSSLTEERTDAGCRHRLFFSQVEYCDNLIFHRRTALDELGERLLDANRTIGQPTKHHDDLRPQNHETLSWPVADRDSGSRSPEPGHPQPLRQRVHQAVRPRSSPAPHRGGHQQCARLRRAQGHRQSLPAPAEAVLDCRQLPRYSARHPGNLRRSRPAPTPHPAHAPPER